MVKKHKTKRKGHKHKKEYLGLALIGVGILLYLGRDQIMAQLGEVSGAVVGGPSFINKLYGPEGYGGPSKSGGGGCTNTQIVQGTCSPVKAQ